MRHGKKVNHLGRTSAHRKAMMANMACSLIQHKRINTTVAKAKALRVFIEPLITKSKAENNQSTEKGTHNRRIAFKNLRDKHAVTALFSEVSEKVGDRPGGYTRIIKLGNRLGDNADMAMIELVDFNETYNAGKAKKKTTRRSRRGSGAKAETVAPVAEETKVEEIVKEAEAVVEEVANEVEAQVQEVETKIEEVAEEVETQVDEIVDEVEDTETKTDESKE